MGKVSAEEMKKYILSKGFVEETTIEPRYKGHEPTEPYGTGLYIDPQDPDGWRHGLENSFAKAIIRHEQHPILNNPKYDKLFSEDDPPILDGVLCDYSGEAENPNHPTIPNPDEVEVSDEVKKRVAVLKPYILAGDKEGAREAIRDYYADGVTLDNYREKTGKRFKMTKDQSSRGLSRDEAFREFKQTFKYRKIMESV
jgi:hypothetical protein